MFLDHISCDMDGKAKPLHGTTHISSPVAWRSDSRAAAEAALITRWQRRLLQRRSATTKLPTAQMETTGRKIPPGVVAVSQESEIPVEGKGRQSLRDLHFFAI